MQDCQAFVKRLGIDFITSNPLIGTIGVTVTDNAIVNMSRLGGIKKALGQSKVSFAIYAQVLTEPTVVFA